ncbi:MAG TPA: hypothetical protein VGR72_10040 [Candidatus Acidoferrales bacterium]|nr:hypothetical protein [Candidatus Acidoferrales bacterium]
MRRGGKTLGSWLAVASVLAACGALAGCGGTPKQPQPLAITAISPASIPAGTPGITLVVSGTDFNTGTFFSFGADSKIAPLQVFQQPCQTAPCGQTAILIIPPNDIAAAGTAKVVATTSGAHSNTETFSITSPQIVTMSPLAVTAGGPRFSLTLEVVNAGPNVQVLFGKDTTPLVPAGPVSCNPLTACAVTVAVPKADIATAGPLTVTVANPFATAGGTTTTNFLAVKPGTGTFPALESANGATPANGASTHSSVSDGGVYVAFDSTATNLPGGTTSGHSEIYLTANCFGAANCTPGTTLISTGSGGAAGTGGVNGSDRPQISADGRFVVFESDDTNLVANATALTEQVYLYDSCNSIFGTVKSCTPGITLVSADSSGNEGNAASANPAISAFGLYIAYQSVATNLTSTAVNGITQQVYLFLSCNGAAGAIAGCTKGTELLSFDQNSSAGDADSVSAAIDPLGMSVAFLSSADNIVPGLPSNSVLQVYLQPTCLEAVPFLGPCTQPTVLVSADSGNNPGVSGLSRGAELAAGGGLVVYSSDSPNLLPAGVTNEQVIGRNICLGLPGTTQCAPSGNIVLSVDTSGVPGAAPSFGPAISGTTVAFTSSAPLVPPGAGRQLEVYSANVCLPPAGSCTTNTTLLSVSASGVPFLGTLGNASIGGGGFATFSSSNSALLISPEIYLAISPVAPAGAVTKLRKVRPE